MHHVDEFIEGKKMQFHKLNKYHGTGEQPAINLTKSDQVPREDDVVETAEFLV